VKNSPQSRDLFPAHGSGKPEGRAANIVNSRGRAYKGGRVLPCAVRFRYWRETEGLSLMKIAARLEDRTREYGMEAPYLLTRLMELEQGRYKPPTWLMFLLAEVYGIKFPWWEFYDGSQQ
jgi:hypothetical protein